MRPSACARRAALGPASRRGAPRAPRSAASSVAKRSRSTRPRAADGEPCSRRPSRPAAYDAPCRQAASSSVASFTVPCGRTARRRATCAQQPVRGDVVGEHRRGEAARRRARGRRRPAPGRACVPRPWRCSASATTIATSARRVVARRGPSAPTPTSSVRAVAAATATSAKWSREVDLGQVAQLAARQARLGRQEALVDALGREPLAARRRAAPCRSGADRPDEDRAVPSARREGTHRRYGRRRALRRCVRAASRRARAAPTPRPAQRWSIGT